MYNRLRDLGIPREKWHNYWPTVETDQMPHCAASDLGIHCAIYTFGGSPD